MLENKLLPLNLQYFADDSTEDQTSDDQSGGEDQTQEQGTDSQQQSEEKGFTQDDVNNLIARETKKQQEKLLKQLGVNDFKDAKEGMQKLKEYQDAQKTDAEKQQEQIEALTNERETLSSTNQSLEAQISAMKQGVKGDSVEDVVALAERRVTDDVTMEDAIKKVVEDYPHFTEKQEQEDSKPNFTTGQHQKGDANKDAFASVTARYKR